MKLLDREPRHDDERTADSADPATPAPTPLTLFGPPIWRPAHGPAQPFTPERPFQLLAHLACRGAWVARDELAAWFWPDRPQGAARSNLRKVLLLAQARVAGAPIEQQGDRLRWNPPSDLQRFESACRERRWGEAIALHAPPLLAGLDTGLPDEALRWLDFERQRVDGLWRDAVDARLAELAGRPAEQARLAEAVLAHDPYDEPAVAALADACLALGDAPRARRALQLHSTRVTEAFGTEPSAPLRHRLAALRDAAPVAVEVAPVATTLPSAAHPNPPPPDLRRAASGVPAGFVGRRAELAQARELLAQPGCRWLTVIGPGGVGKSSFARTLAAQPFLPGEAVWTALHDLTQADEVPDRLAQRLGLALEPGAARWPALARQVGARCVVLCLDNAEHLPGLGAALDGLLDACPGLTLIVTSRARLAAPREWLLPLDGLQLPDADETDLEVLRAHDAVRLFEQRALAAGPGFALGRCAADVVRLLHAVEGLPLAIELAAGWTRVLPVREIVAELAVSLELLNTGRAGAGYPRDGGLQASFEHSWRLLGPVEQQALVRLALLPGSCFRDVAQQVAQVALPVLAALVDKSLVRAEADGRFSLHGLVGQCASAKAGAVGIDAVDAAARHAAWWRRWAARYDNRLVLQKTAALADVEQALPHLRAAARWALDHATADIALPLVQTLAEFFRIRGRWAEARELLDHAVPRLDDGSPARARDAAAAWACMARLRFHMNDAAGAEAAARQALRLGGDAATRHSALINLGNALVDLGRVDDALGLFRQALRHAVRDGDLHAQGVAQACLATANQALGRYDEAVPAYEASAAFFRRTEDAEASASTANNLGALQLARSAPAAALPWLEEALALYDAHGLRSSRPYALSNIGLALKDLGRPAEAVPRFEAALAEVREHGEPLVEVHALCGAAGALAVLGERRAAWRRLGEAAEAARRLDFPAVQVMCVLVWAELLAAEGEAPRAASLLRWTIAQPETGGDDRDIARRRLAALPVAPAELVGDTRRDALLGALRREAAARG